MLISKSLQIVLIIIFLVSSLTPVPKAHGSTALTTSAALALPEPGTMVNLSPAFEPVLIKGIKVHPENPFAFDFIVDTGNEDLSALDLSSRDSGIRDQAGRLIKYFLASLTIPEKDLWVNLSPYEKDHLIADNLGKTQMGQDMLAQDYILKQLTASLIYPEKELGKAFWDKVYQKAQQLYGTTEMPVNTFNKVWIVADKADVFERGNVAYIVGAHLKVMLEEDYTALNKNQQGLSSTNTTQLSPPKSSVGGPGHGASSSGFPTKTFGNDSHAMASQIVRDIILPSIEQEVNQGKNFAPLRQMFYSMILASWYKMALKDTILTRIYGNQSKVKAGINATDPTDKDKIFEQYLKAYKKGVFNYIKEDLNSTTKEITPRKYFSGGLEMGVDSAMRVFHKLPLGASLHTGEIFDVHADAAMVHGDAAMTAKGFAEAVIVGAYQWVLLRKPVSTDDKALNKRLRSPSAPYILIVDEQSAWGEIYRRTFTDTGFGFDVTVVKDHQEAEQFLHNPRNKGKIAFIMTYDGVGKGLKFARETAKQGLDVPIVLFSSNDLRDQLTSLDKFRGIRFVLRDNLQALIHSIIIFSDGSRSGDEAMTGQMLDPERAKMIEAGDGTHFFVSYLDKNLRVARHFQDRYAPIDLRFQNPISSLGRYKDLVILLEGSQLRVFWLKDANTVAQIDPKVIGRFALKVDDAGEGGEDILNVTGTSGVRGKIDLKALSQWLGEMVKTGPQAIIREVKFEKGGKSPVKYLVDAAMNSQPAATPGGIDLDRSKMQMNVKKEGEGVQMQFDPATIERIKREGFDGLEFKIDTIVPVANLPMLLGLREDEQESHPQLAGA